MLNKKFFLMLAVAGFSSMGLMADETVKSMNVKDEEGNTVQIKEDGSKLIKKTDGTSIEIKPDGSKHIRKADGTTVDINPGQ